MTYIDRVHPNTRGAGADQALTITMLHQHDDTSRALLDAAQRILADHGASALTVRRIATEAGMSTMNVYSRFGGKDGVLDELHYDGFRRLRASLESVPQTGTAATDIVGVAIAYREFALANPSYYDVMFSRSVPGYRPSSAASDFSLQALTTMAQRIEQAQADGEIADGDGRDPISITAWLWATFHGMVSLELEGLGDELVEWSAVYQNGVRCAVNGLHPSIHA